MLDLTQGLNTTDMFSCLVKYDSACFLLSPSTNKTSFDRDIRFKTTRQVKDAVLTMKTRLKQNVLAVSSSHIATAEIGQVGVLRDEFISKQAHGRNKGKTQQVDLFGSLIAGLRLLM